MKKNILTIGCIIGILVNAFCFVPLVLADSGVGPLPMTVWGSLKYGATDVAAGAKVVFGNSQGEIIGSLVTVKDGQYGGDTAYDQNIALSEFSGNLAITVIIDGTEYTLSSENIDNSDAAEGCPAKEAISFAEQKKCRYDIDLAKKMSESSAVLNTSLPIGLDYQGDKRGKFLQPVEWKDPQNNDLQAAIDKYSAVTDENGAVFYGVLFPPRLKSNAIANEIGDDVMIVKKVIHIGSDKHLRISKPYKITIPLGDYCPARPLLVYSSVDGNSWVREGITASIQGSSPNCAAYFYISHMTYFAIGSDTTTTTTTSSSSSGGGGGGASGPNTTIPYRLSPKESDTLASITCPLSLADTEGKITRSVEISNYYQKYKVSIPKDTKITRENGEAFSGIIAVPSYVAKKDRPKVAENLEEIVVMTVGAKSGENLSFSQSFTLTIPVRFTKRIDPERVGVYYFNEVDQEYELVAGGELSEDQKTVTIQVSHMSQFAVLYAQEGAETPNDVAEAASMVFAFKDIAGHWGKEYIENLTEKGIFTNQEFYRPDDLVNRAELAKIIVEAFDIETETAEKFPDVDENLWYGKYVYAVKNKGIIQGYPDGTFRPVNNVLRSEALKMMILSAGVENPEGDLMFTDVPKDSWFAPYVGYAVENEIVQGINKDVFAPGYPMTRAQVAKIISILLNQ